ncbi:MAG TPA: right-handed parallel beta-helix repeat-containing protein, partial [Pyrinomonadaceae bacterium]|nr:right-handed parallel beta-helix repeat-containing protein [Pyrinomonadaceae bacterium]
MNKVSFPVRTLGFVILSLAFASLAQAQATRTWVSGVGDDVNPCSRTAPCKTWAGAISKTAAGGEIDALDPGGYGTLTITKSITVDGTTGAGFGSTLNSGGINGFVINDSLSATPNTAKVVLRNLSINGAGTTPGLNGIRFLAGKELVIDNVTIENQSSHGIDVSLNAAVQGRVFIVDTVVQKCTGDGVSMTNANASGEVRAAITRSSFVQNGNGLHARSNSRVVARECVFSLNNTNGVFSDAVTAATFSSVSVWDSQISGNNANGVRAGNVGNVGNSGATLAFNQIERNTSNGVLVSTNGAVETFTNNSIRGNGTDGCAG